MVKEETLIARRILSITGNIDSKNVDDIQKSLFQMALSDLKRPAHLVINSGGGSMMPALTIHDTIKGMPFEVEATVIGNCHSAALTILGACSKRRATMTSRFLFHAIRAEETIRSTEDVERQIFEMSRRVKTVFEQALKIQSLAFNISEDVIKEMMKEGQAYDIKLTAEEAKQKGVIHEIIEKFDFLQIA